MIYLYQHIEILYKIAIDKYPKCIRIKLGYVQFLYEAMHKRQQALIELNNIMSDNYMLSFEDFFILYKLKHDMEDLDDVSMMNSNNAYTMSYNMDY